MPDKNNNKPPPISRKTSVTPLLMEQWPGFAWAKEIQLIGQHVISGLCMPLNWGQRSQGLKSCQHNKARLREGNRWKGTFPFYSLGCLLYIPAVSYMNAVLHLSLLFNFPEPVTTLYRANSVVRYSAKALLYNSAWLHFEQINLHWKFSHLFVFCWIQIDSQIYETTDKNTHN